MTKTKTSIAIAGVLLATGVAVPAWLASTDTDEGARAATPARLSASSPHTSPVHPSEDSPTDPRALFTRWNQALKTADPHKITDLYAPGAVLLPTASSKVRDTPAEIADYFEHFMASKPTGALDTSHVAAVDDDHLLHMGTYTFVKEDGSSVKARYTYMYERVDGNWLITHHHSSAMPSDAPAPA